MACGEREQRETTERERKRRGGGGGGERERERRERGEEERERPRRFLLGRNRLNLLDLRNSDSLARDDGVKRAALRALCPNARSGLEWTAKQQLCTHWGTTRVLGSGTMSNIPAGVVAHGRRVSLSVLPEDYSAYQVARAWVRNKPRGDDRQPYILPISRRAALRTHVPSHILSLYICARQAQPPAAAPSHRRRRGCAYKAVQPWARVQASAPLGGAVGGGFAHRLVRRSPRRRVAAHGDWRRPVARASGRACRRRCF